MQLENVCYRSSMCSSLDLGGKKEGCVTLGPCLVVDQDSPEVPS